MIRQVITSFRISFPFHVLFHFVENTKCVKWLIDKAFKSKLFEIKNVCIRAGQVITILTRLNSWNQMTVAGPTRISADVYKAVLGDPIVSRHQRYANTNHAIQVGHALPEYEKSKKKTCNWRLSEAFSKSHFFSTVLIWLICMLNSKSKLFHLVMFVQWSRALIQRKKKLEREIWCHQVRCVKIIAGNVTLKVLERVLPTPEPVSWFRRVTSFNSARKHPFQTNQDTWQPFSAQCTTEKHQGKAFIQHFIYFEQTWENHTERNFNKNRWLNSNGVNMHIWQ